jgi:arylformamidase
MSGGVGWIDVTRPMDQNLICWPGRTPPRIAWTKRVDRGDHCNVSAWELIAHTGTHIDAPRHFVEGGTTIDQVSPEVLIGPCQVVTDGAYDANTLVGAARVLVRTGYSRIREFEHHPALMHVDAARALLRGGMRLIGTDRLSVDDTQTATFELHHLLLGSGCVIIEGLNLDPVADGAYEIVAMPLRMVGAEASPARVLLRSHA